MRRSYDRRGIRAEWVMWIALGVLVILIAVLGTSVWGMYYKYREAKEKKENLSMTLSALEQRETELRKKVEALETERGIETEIRGKFQVAKEGEGVIYLVDSEPEATATPERKLTIWEWLLSWFGV